MAAPDQEFGLPAATLHDWMPAILRAWQNLVWMELPKRVRAELRKMGSPIQVQLGV
jgi:hypothetical protein